MNGLTKALYISVLMAIFIGSVVSISFAAILGERVEFSPANPRPGETVTLTVHFQVEGEPLTALNMDYVTDPPSPPRPPAPLIVGRFDVGRHTYRLTYTLPTPVPPRICFTINTDIDGDGRPQAIITGACLETTMRVASTGTGRRTVAVAGPQIPTNPEGPDLRILEVRPVNRSTGVVIPIVSHAFAIIRGDPVIPVDTDAFIDIKIQNIGRITAENIRTHVEYNIADRWVPFTEPETIRRLDPGHDVNRRIQRVIPRGATGIKVIVDPYNQIREIDEGNNTFIGFFGQRR